MLNRLSEFIKLAEIAIITTLGSVEDEHTFSTLGFHEVQGQKSSWGAPWHLREDIFTTLFQTGHFPLFQSYRSLAWAEDKVGS